MDMIDRELFDEEVRRIPRVFRDRSNPLDSLGDDSFRARFRFTRHGFFELLEFVKGDLEKRTMRGKALLPYQRLALTLQTLAANNFQIVTGDLAGCHQTTVSRIIEEVCSVFTKKVDSFVYWPSDSETLNIQKKFYDLIGIPNIVGCIDGSHVRIVAPSEEEHRFVNRFTYQKSYHSINVGLVCDFDLRFRWASARFPGSSHDSRVFRESSLHGKLMRKEVGGVLLGDSAYRAERFLYKPILATNSPSEIRYTNALCRGRVLIENAIGALKRQFHCLHSELRYAPKKAADIIITCVCLRNAAISMKEPTFTDAIPPPDDDDAEPDCRDGASASAEGGAAMRLVIAKYF